MAPSTSRALPWIAAAAALLALGGGLYGCSKQGGGDRLSDAQAGAAQGAAENLADNVIERAAAADPMGRCASTASYALLKRELFRRAAQIRGKDDAMLDRVASAAALRVERPIVRSRDEGLGSIACAATASVDLPPGLAVAGDRTTLTADLDYTLQPAADGSGDVLTLTNADAITVSLATVGRSVASPPPTAIDADGLAPLSSSPAPPPFSPTVTRGNPARVAPGDPLAPKPSPLTDPTLVALERRVTAQYRDAVAAADPDQRAALRQTGRRFAGFVDNCPDTRCRADGYRQRLREIDDIMAGDRR